MAQRVERNRTTNVDFWVSGLEFGRGAPYYLDMNNARNWTAIEGWMVRYYEPTFGMREFFTNALSSDRVWLDAGGYMYTVREVPKGAR